MHNNTIYQLCKHSDKLKIKIIQKEAAKFGPYGTKNDEFNKLSDSSFFFGEMIQFFFIYLIFRHHKQKIVLIKVNEL